MLVTDTKITVEWLQQTKSIEEIVPLIETLQKRYQAHLIFAFVSLLIGFSVLYLDNVGGILFCLLGLSVNSIANHANAQMTMLKLHAFTHFGWTPKS